MERVSGLAGVMDWRCLDCDLRWDGRDGSVILRVDGSFGVGMGGCLDWRCLDCDLGANLGMGCDLVGAAGRVWA